MTGIALWAYSCAGVDLETASNGDARYLCRFAFDKDEELVPEEFVLAMARSLNTVHDTAHVKPEILDDTLYIAAGDYHSLAWGFSVPDDYTVYKEEEFLQDKSVSLLDLSARLREADYSENEDPLIQALLPQDVTNLPVIPEASPLWHSYIRSELSYKADRVDFLEFIPQKIIQRLTFKVRIQVEGDLVVERAAACIRGVARGVELLSASIAPDDLGRTIFELSNNTADIYTGTINTLGLLSPINTEDLFGRGVLTVVIQFQGVSQLTEIHINLFNELKASALVSEIDVTGRYRLECAEGIVDATAKVIHIRNQSDSPEESGAFDVWVEGDDEDNDHTIEVIPDEPDE